MCVFVCIFMFTYTIKCAKEISSRNFLEHLQSKKCTSLFSFRGQVVHDLHIAALYSALPS